MSTPTLLKQFSDQIWSARRKTHKNLRNESEQAYRQAFATARGHGLYAESLIAQAAIYELNEQFEEAIWYLEQSANDKSNQLEGIAWFFLGSAYRERHPVLIRNPQNGSSPYKAIEYYQNALKDEAFDKRNWALNNLGNIYLRQGDYAEAAKQYEECLKFPDPATHYITWYNQGRLALAMKKYPEALAHLDRSVNGTEDDFDMRGSCYREMGTALMLDVLENGRPTETHDEKVSQAIRCWEKAQSEFDRFDSRSKNQPGRSGKSAVALAKMRIAQRYLDKRPPLETFRSNLKPDDRVLLTWWPPEETGPDGYSTPEERIFSQIEAVKYDRYQQYSKRNQPTAQPGNGTERGGRYDNTLIILRGWGSASPLIEDASSACRGGGYLVKWRGKGLVIDPGLDFLYNFRANKFHMREVQAVAVSHDHTDHNFDLMALDDIFYEMAKRAETEEEKKAWCYTLLCDEQTRKKPFLLNQAFHRKVDEVIYRDLKGLEDKEKTFWAEDLKLPFHVHFFRVKHGKGFPAFGLRVECLSEDWKKTEATIGFTCDTEYFDQMSQDDDDALAKHLQQCDVMIAHVSQPTLAELLSSGASKETHLGYRGVAKLIRQCNPGLTLLGEFWAGFADMRIDIAKGLKRINDKAIIIPSSIGLFVDPKANEIECSNCKNWVPADTIHVTAATQEFGPLGYICPLCQMKP